MGAWYTIGAFLGFGLGVGVALVAILGWNKLGIAAAAVAAVPMGSSFALAFGEAEGIAGGVGGLLGALSAAAIVHGARRRGATRIGIVAYGFAFGVLIWMLAFIPVVGYLEAVALPFLAVRSRGRRAARFAGLRTLAK